MKFHPAFTINSEQVRSNCAEQLRHVPLGTRVTFRAARRSDAQNDKMWSMLTDIAEHVVWCGQKWTKDDWKEILSAYLHRQRFVPQIDDDGNPGGGLVALGARTREFTVKDMGYMIDACDWFGGLHGVVFKEPKDKFADQSQKTTPGGAGGRGGAVSAAKAGRAGGTVPPQSVGGGRSP